MKVPEFSAAADSKDEDFLTESGAQRLADVIESAWRECGQSVKCRIEVIGTARNKAYAVRSDLVNGLPRR